MAILTPGKVIAREGRRKKRVIERGWSNPQAGLTGRDLQNIPLKTVRRTLHRLHADAGRGPVEKKKRICLFMSPSTINFFKGEAKIQHTKYQRYMRAILDQFAARRIR